MARGILREFGRLVVRVNEEYSREGKTNTEILVGLRKATDAVRSFREEMIKQLDFPLEVLLLPCMDPVYYKTSIPILLQVALQTIKCISKQPE